MFLKLTSKKSGAKHLININKIIDIAESVNTSGEFECSCLYLKMNGPFFEAKEKLEEIEALINKQL